MSKRFRQLALGLVAAALLLLALQVSGQSPAPAKPASPPPLPSFVDVTEKAGINFRHSFGEVKLSSIMEATGSGCAWFDYNNDGWLDLYVVSGRYLEGVTKFSKPDGVDATNHLYRNNGDGTFTDVTQQAGVGGKGFGMGVTVGDYDNDGFEDIYVTDWNSAVLYHNNGDGTFTDVTAKAGVDNPHFGVGTAWLDYDRDGKLDLYVGNYLKFDPNAKMLYFTADAFPGPLDYEGDADRLFHNNGDGTFTDVSHKAGIDNPLGRAMGVTTGDFDNDGWPDVYVANDTMESYMYHNNHDGTFTNVAPDVNTAFGANGEATSAMNPIFGDYDNDGWQDLFVSDMRYHRLFHNPGKERFWLDTTVETGVAQVSGQYVAWGDGFFDFDNDGWKDIYVVNGGLHWLIPMEDSVLRNNGNGTFTDVSAQAGNYFRLQKGRPWRLLCRLRQRRVHRRLHHGFGWQRNPAAQQSPTRWAAQSLADAETGGDQEQPRRVRGAPGSSGGRAAPVCAASFGKRIPLAGRPPPALRPGAAYGGGPTHHHLAQRHRANPRAREGGPDSDRDRTF